MDNNYLRVRVLLPLSTRVVKLRGYFSSKRKWRRRAIGQRLGMVFVTKPFSTETFATEAVQRK